MGYTGTNFPPDYDNFQRPKPSIKNKKMKKYKLLQDCFTPAFTLYKGDTRTEREWGTCFGSCMMADKHPKWFAEVTKEDIAIEFAEWLMDSSFKVNDIGFTKFWTSVRTGPVTVREAFEIFKEERS